MREALIVWGGWAGHEPEQGARIIAGMLEEAGFKTYLESTTEAFADPGIAELSLIVPIFTMAKIEKEELDSLARAVESGVGLAGYHGGMGDARLWNTISWSAVSGSRIRETSSTTLSRSRRRRTRSCAASQRAFLTGPSNIICMLILLTRFLRRQGSRVSMHPGSTEW